MTLSVHLTWKAEGEFLEDLRSALGPGASLSVGPDVPEPADYHWLVGGLPTREQLRGSPHLRGLIIPWAGLPLRTAELMADFPQLAIHNLHHNASATAEMAVGLMLAAAKQIVPADRTLRGGDWSHRYAEWSAPLLEDRTAVVLGYGAIGQRVGRACRALGMGVIGVRRQEGELLSQRPDSAEEVVTGSAELDRVLPWADVLVISVPATAQTQSLLDRRRIALLPRDSILVNVARGTVVEEEALYDALRSGAIGSAGIDVWYQYPKDEESRATTFPSKFPFHELANVVLSPHRAGHTRETEGRRAAAVAELLLEAAAGREVPNRVDLGRGY